MSVCAGVLPLAQAGLLRNKSAAAPPPLLPSLRHGFPDTAWEEARWVCDAGVWSCGVVVGGVEMMAAWMREYFWDRGEAVEWVLRAAGQQQQQQQQQQRQQQNTGDGELPFGGVGSRELPRQAGLVVGGGVQGLTTRWGGE
ncbi:hypothetical protein AOQ84DRAFT_222650 [Glonium stellatum]|uniref:Uncharacterized protein n=1 Tax=Glonium stellatum TaxID=574774 RepID=A0A8E2JSM1_9PEZI|nr:hypothetical protein AOQ84DRAFT_222650 [Glonium stellatum]